MFVPGIDHLLYAVLLMAAEYIHIHFSVRRRCFYLRASATITAVSLISLLLPEAQGALWAVPFNFLVRAVLFGMTVLGWALCYEVDLFYAVSRCLFGYLTYSAAHVFTLFFTETFQLTGAAYYGVLAGTFTVIYAIFAVFSLRRVSRGMKPARWKYQIAGVLALVTAAFSYISMDIHWEYIDDYLLPAYLFIVYLCLMLLHIFADEKHLHDDYEMIKQLMEKEARQYEVSKELIDRINQKAHDLKYQIRHLSTAGGSEALQELEEAIDVYDTGYKTGNDALDVIMTEKSQQCRKYHIRVACILDGEKLSAMEPRDIYSLVGNILDNAIEAVQQLPDEDMRVINLSVKQEFGMVRIRAENYYAGRRSFQNDLPLTTKEDKLWHGYGTKSILTIAEKYGGTAEFSAENGIFTVNVLLPASPNPPDDI